MRKKWDERKLFTQMYQLYKPLENQNLNNFTTGSKPNQYILLCNNSYKRRLTKFI